MPNNSGGGVQIFFGKTNFSAGQIDSAYGGAIANHDTGTAPVDYLQMRKKQGATLNRDGEMLDLENDVEGMSDEVITAPDKWTLDMEITEISKVTLFNLAGLDPSAALDWAASASIVAGKLSYIGTSMLARGFPVLILRSSYDGGNTGDIPKLGSGSDPLAWCWFKMVVASRKLELKYDPKGQLYLPLSLKPVAVDGTTNKGVAFCHGALTKLA